MPAISATPETALSTNAIPTKPQGLWRDPSVLERTWTPSVLVGRDQILGYLETRVLPRLTSGGGVGISIFGPRGSGTSTVAAHLVAAAKARLTRSGAKGAPLLLRIDTSDHRTPSSVVTALFREIDPSYDGRGASAEFGLLLLLRRLRTLARPVILVLDQIGSRADLSRVLRPLARPDCLMPEGPASLPTMLVVAAGARDAFPEDVEAIRTRLPPLVMAELCQAITARANLAFEVLPAQEALETIARLSVAQGWGLSMVGELLAEAGRRVEARGGHRVEPEDVGLPAIRARHGHDTEGFDAVILEVLRASPKPLSAGELRRRVGTRCEEVGIRGPTQARLWRHVVALERKGVVRREVRVGGTGGSSSVVSPNPVRRPEAQE